MKISTSLSKLLLLLTATAILAFPSLAETKLTKAVAVIESTTVAKAPKNRVIGVLHFTQVDGKLRLTGTLKGLPANSTHGFHIHEFGDISKSDGTSAGGHFNPEGHPHAGPHADKRHAGDLGNIKTDAKGEAKIDVTLDDLTLAEGPNAVLGRALVVHAKSDDLKSQPSGDAGDRIGVGVIGWASAQK